MRAVPPMGLDLKLTDAEGVTLPQQRGVVGHLRSRAPRVVDRYFKAESDALDEEGYFDTGDLAMIDEAGNLTICGRSKDLIKSGGEWINPGRDRGDRRPRSRCRVRRGDRPDGREMGRAPGAGRRAAPGARARRIRRCSACCAARSPTGGCPTRSRRSQRCRSPPPARSTRTGCAPTTPSGRIEGRAGQSLAARDLRPASSAPRGRRSSPTRSSRSPCAGTSRSSFSSYIPGIRSRAGVGVAAKCM